MSDPWVVERFENYERMETFPVQMLQHAEV